MSGIGKFLYPPIVPTYQTPFVHTDNSCRIYFSISSYNKISDFSDYVQVSISTQKDNRTVLKEATGVLFSKYEIDNDIKGDNKYYITIYNDDIKDGFKPEVYYKVQIRLIKSGVNVEGTFFDDHIGSFDFKFKPKNFSKDVNWINQNLDNFTEWSTITLIKSIYKPTFILNPFSSGDEHNKKIIFSTGFQTLSGTVIFNKDNSEEAQSTEYLKSYRIYIIKKENGKDVVYMDSGEIYPINKNEVFYNMKKKLENGSDYSITIELYTNNGYIIKQSGYNFTIFKMAESEIDASVSTKPDYVNGRVKIKITTKELSFVNNFIIIRASSKDNFSIWDDVHYCSFYDEKIKEYIWYDYTVESGVLYKYAIQRIDIRNNLRSREKVAFNEDDDASIVMLPLEDIFLSREGMQFKIKFDPNISSFKTNLLETKTETLGSKHPFIRRNGKVKYKEFPIGGLITTFCDEEGLFLNRKNLYTEEEDSYYNDTSLGYNINHSITEYKDFVYEKLFRDKIVEFLQEDSVKLFRSQTEGNILIKLTNISLTPNQSLGRMLYSFSATAIEVADCTIENYDKYGIQLLRKDSLKNETIRYTHKIGQLIGTSTSKFWEDNIIGYLNNICIKTFSKEDVKVSIENLEWLKLTFNSKPYLINTGSVGISVDSIENRNNAFLGYLAKINNNTIIINSNGIYELKGDNVCIKSLSIPDGVEFTLDYIAKIKIESLNEPTFKRRVLLESIGQIHDTFKINESFINKIRHKYIIKHPRFSQNFSLLNDITIEADCGTVLDIIQNVGDEKVVSSYEIGKTNLLKFKDEYEEGVFNNFSFKGVRLYKKPQSTDVDYLLKVSSTDGKFKVISYKEYNTYKNNEIDEDGNIIKYGYPYIIEIMEQSRDNVYIAEDNYLDLSEVNIDNPRFLKTKLNNCLFTVNNKLKMYHKNEWYDFDENEQIVKCPINALVNYTYNLIREEY